MKRALSERKIEANVTKRITLADLITTGLLAYEMNIKGRVMLNSLVYITSLSFQHWFLCKCVCCKVCYGHTDEHTCAGVFMLLGGYRFVNRGMHEWRAMTFTSKRCNDGGRHRGGSIQVVHDYHAAGRSL